MTFDPTYNRGSFSYDFVAGASRVTGAPSVNPDAVVSSSTGSVQIGGHASYTINGGVTQSGSRTINVPTMVRTGTGSIRMTAAGDFKLIDTAAPGVVYTAGVATTPPSGFTAPSVPEAYTGRAPDPSKNAPGVAGTPTGLVATPTWAKNGGSVTITAGGSITGIETWGGTAGQFWADWYAHYGAANGTNAPFSGCITACQTAAWINYNTFFQGIGALGGGNITLTAGQDITAISASLPETLAVSGGFLTTDANNNIINIPPTAHYYGGGNLVVKAGRNLNASTFLVGRGSGTIDVGGNIQYDSKNPIQGAATAVSGNVLPLMLAVQDGFVSVNARGAATLGSIYDPASLPSGLSAQTAYKLLPGGDGVGSHN
jgi:hypothetical protein